MMPCSVSGSVSSRSPWSTVTTRQNRPPAGCAGWHARPCRQYRSRGCPSGSGNLQRASAAAGCCPFCASKLASSSKAKSAIQPGRAVERHLHGFEQEGAAAAHRVDQRHARLPAGHLEDAGRQIFLERRIDAGLAKPRCHSGWPEVSRYSVHSFSVRKDMNADIRVARLDIRPLAEVFAEAVADGILDAQRHESPATSAGT
jgi:hypothetical protein